jgi:hypothetical protein
MWAVAGPPRSGTTMMLEAVALWTPLRVRWDLSTEWASRSQVRPEPFLEIQPSRLGEAGQDEVVKILDPALPVEPVRVIIMRRDPVQVAASTTKTLGRLSAEAVEERYVAFLRRFSNRVDVINYADVTGRDPASLGSVFAALRDSGWPVRDSPWPALSMRGVS